MITHCICGIQKVLVKMLQQISLYLTIRSTKACIRESFEVTAKQVVEIAIQCVPPTLDIQQHYSNWRRRYPVAYISVCSKIKPVLILI